MIYRALYNKRKKLWEVHDTRSGVIFGPYKIKPTAFGVATRFNNNEPLPPRPTAKPLCYICGRRVGRSSGTRYNFCPAHKKQQRYIVRKPSGRPQGPGKPIFNQK